MLCLPPAHTYSDRKHTAGVISLKSHFERDSGDILHPSVLLIVSLRVLALRLAAIVRSELALGSTVMIFDPDRETTS